ncbi:hypothetical protein SprV_0802547800 [Sparganum proliferum]
MHKQVDARKFCEPFAELECAAVPFKLPFTGRPGMYKFAAAAAAASSSSSSSSSSPSSRYLFCFSSSTLLF